MSSVLAEQLCISPSFLKCSVPDGSHPAKLRQMESVTISIPAMPTMTGGRRGVAGFSEPITAQRSTPHLSKDKIALSFSSKSDYTPSSRSSLGGPHKRSSCFMPISSLVPSVGSSVLHSSAHLAAGDWANGRKLLSTTGPIFTTGNSLATGQRLCARFWNVVPEPGSNANISDSFSTLNPMNSVVVRMGFTIREYSLKASMRDVSEPGTERSDDGNRSTIPVPSDGASFESNRNPESEGSTESRVSVSRDGTGFASDGVSSAEKSPLSGLSVQENGTGSGPNGKTEKPETVVQIGGLAAEFVASIPMERETDEIDDISRVYSDVSADGFAARIADVSSRQGGDDSANDGNRGSRLQQMLDADEDKNVPAGASEKDELEKNSKPPESSSEGVFLSREESDSGSKKNIDPLRVFVGNLPWEIPSPRLCEEIGALFSQFGTVVNVEMATYPKPTKASLEKGKHCGFGFVQMNNAEDAKRAISILNQRPFRGVPLQVAPGVVKNGPYPPRENSEPLPPKLKGPRPGRHHTKLFVGGLHRDTTAEALKEIFGRYGRVVDAKVVRTRITRQSMGFGFVTLHTEEAALKAIEDRDGSFIDGNTVKVNIAQYARVR